MSRRYLAASLFFLLHSLASTVIAHSHEDAHFASETTYDRMLMTEASAAPYAAMTDYPVANVTTPMSYFHYGEHAGIMYAHIGLAVVAWILVLPIAVMLSIARSPLSLPCQLVFHVLNVLSIATSVVYNAQTPDLYENNVHHKAAWAITFIVMFWTLMSFVKLYIDRAPASRAFTISHQAMADHNKAHGTSNHRGNSWSRDSGQGTERNTESLCNSPRRANSWHSESSNPAQRIHDEDDEFTEHDTFLNNAGKRQEVADAKLASFASATASRVLSVRRMLAFNIIYIVIERSLAVLASFLLVTGAVTYSGVFRERHVFGGLAHSIKGGIFFWYGLLTLGRWMGCFYDYGWSWNIRPPVDIVGKGRAWIPSAEFTESFVIFLYGASNVFLEHLGGWGQAWSAQDLEHIAITIMFFGGGLLGMLIESRRVRNLMNSALLNHADDHEKSSSPIWESPESYIHSMNPMPALVIMLLGIMMSGHHQHSMTSAMVHKQWGLLFAGFAIARGATYLILWISPPRSYLPTKPPSEIIASFCLTAGGIIFIASNGDTVEALDSYGLDAMFIFTIAMGLTALIMAWAFSLVALKGWFVSRQSPQSSMSPA